VTVSAFNLSVQDNVRGDYLLFHPTTGAYFYRRCGAQGTTLSGTGQASKVGCLRQLKHLRADGITVKASVNTCSTSYAGLPGYAGSGAVILASKQQWTLSDSDTRNNPLTCPSP
jgi:hypothetical protein